MNKITHEESMKALDYIGAKIDSLQEVNKELVEALKQAYADLKSLSTGGPSFHDRTLPQIEQVLLKAGGQMNNQPTPRPWRLEINSGDICANTNEYELIAQINSALGKEKQLANSRLIVTAVNCHDELVSVLEECRLWNHGDKFRNSTGSNRLLWQSHMDKIEQALSKAESEA